MGIFTAACTLGTGWLLDRSPPRLLLADLLALFGVMMAVLPMVDTPVEVWLYGGAFGVTQGMQEAILGSGYAYYFGRAHHGTIRGLATPIFIGGTALGPAVLALGPDLMGGFAPILWLTAPVPFLLALVSVAAWRADWDGDVLIADR